MSWAHRRFVGWFAFATQAYRRIIDDRRSSSLTTATLEGALAHCRLIGATPADFEPRQWPAMHNLWTSTGPDPDRGLGARRRPAA